MQSKYIGLSLRPIKSNHPRHPNKSNHLGHPNKSSHPSQVFAVKPNFVRITIGILLQLEALFRTKKPLFIIYVFLLFNPAAFSGEILQCVYRNGVTLFQVLFVFGALIGVYLRREKPGKALLKWLFIAGFALASMWHTREDSMWILPFVIVVIGVLIVYTIIDNKRREQKIHWKKCLLFLLPMIMLFVSNHAISFINYKVYGIYSYNEINDSNFGKAIEAIYSVKNEEDITYVSVTRDKMQKLYEVSPTLNSIKDQLENSMSAWANNDRTPGDNEVEDGWFFWSLRGAVNQAGLYSSAQTADEFYKQIAAEIQTAVDEGKLEEQSTMPSALMSPWRKGYTAKLIDTMGEIINFVTGFNDNNAINIVSTTEVGDGSDILLFEAITNNYAIYPGQTATIEGWYVYLDEGEVNFIIEDSTGNVITKLENLPSTDVSLDLKAKGITIKSDYCRFSTQFELNTDENLYFCVYDSKRNVLDKLDLSTADSNSNDVSIYHFDQNTYGGNIRQETAQKYIDRANLVSRAYQILGKPVAVLAFLSYIYLIVLTVKSRFKGQVWDITLILSGIILSLLVLFFGVAYNHIASCDSINTLYLSGSYPLLLAFEWIAICAAVGHILNFLRQKKHMDAQPVSPAKR